MKKYSKKRDALYKALCASKEHPSAETLYNSLKPEYPDISLGTVYRNLAMFRAEGSALSVAVVNGQERFDGDTSPHTHFICDGCGAVCDVACAPDSDLCSSVGRELGARVARCEMIFHGMCSECLKAEAD